MYSPIRCRVEFLNLLLKMRDLLKITQKENLNAHTVYTLNSVKYKNNIKS